MIRLIFLGFLFYFAYKILTYVMGFFASPEKQEVKGQGKKPPLDLGNADVEDADFEDIK